MSALIGFLTALLRGLLEVVLSTPKATGRTVSGSALGVPTTPESELRKRAKASGLMLVLVFAAISCGTTKVVVATGFPVDEATEGWPRIAQDEVKVLLKDGTIGTISPAGGYRVIHDADLRGLLKMSKGN